MSEQQSVRPQSPLAYTRATGKAAAASFGQFGFTPDRNVAAFQATLDPVGGSTGSTIGN
jgi:hypothetical protein